MVRKGLGQSMSESNVRLDPLAAVFESFDAGLLGDIFVQVFDENLSGIPQNTPREEHLGILRLQG